MRLIALLVLSVFLCGCLAVIGSRPAGPPMHAKAHGLHKKHTYYYYPDLEIYWDAGARTYIAWDNGVWASFKVRPIIITPSHSYTVIEVEQPSPWLRHSHYKKQFPRGHHKKHHRGRR